MKAILTMLLCLYGLIAYSQSISRSVISAGGESLENAPIVLSWTLGEAVGGTFMTDEVMLTQGFQQPNIKVMEVMLRTVESDIDFSAQVSPNPFMESLVLEVNSEKYDEVIYQIYDQGGRVVSSASTIPTREVVDVKVQVLASGSYFLNIRNTEGAILSTFQIIKTN